MKTQDEMEFEKEFRRQRVAKFFEELLTLPPAPSFTKALSQMTSLMTKIEADAYEESKSHDLIFHRMAVPKWAAWSNYDSYAWIHSAFTTKQCLMISSHGAIAIYPLIVEEGNPITNPNRYKNIASEKIILLKPNTDGKSIWEV